MISNLMFFIRSETRSRTASLVIRKRADVPSVTALRTRFDEIVVDAIVAKGAAQRPKRRADGHAEQWREEDEPEEQSPEHAAHGPDRDEVDELPRFRTLLPVRPGHNRRVKQFNQVFCLQSPNLAQGILGAIRFRKLEHGYSCHNAHSF